MLKKFGAKRELKKRTNGLEPDKRITYLQKILSKKSMLTQDTRDVAYSLLGDSYKQIGKEKFANSRGKMGNSEIISAAESYAHAGEFSKASGLIGKNFSKGHKLRSSGGHTVATNFGAPIEIESSEAKRLENLIDKESLNRGGEVRKRKKIEYAPMRGLVVFAIATSIFAGLYLLSPNITGNVVGSSGDIGNWIGGVLLIIGLVAGYSLIKK